MSKREATEYVTFIVGATLNGTRGVSVRETVSGQARVSIGDADFIISMESLRDLVNSGADVLDKWFDMQEKAAVSK